MCNFVYIFDVCKTQADDIVVNNNFNAPTVYTGDVMSLSGGSSPQYLGAWPHGERGSASL